MMMIQRTNAQICKYFQVFTTTEGVIKFDTDENKVNGPNVLLSTSPPLCVFVNVNTSLFGIDTIIFLF